MSSDHASDMARVTAGLRAAWRDFWQALRDDLAAADDQSPAEVARQLIEVVIGAALLYRLLIHVSMAVGQGDCDHPLDVSYRWVQCHVPAASDDVAHRARVMTGLIGVMFVYAGLPIVDQSHPASLVLAVNAGVLIGDPLSPLILPRAAGGEADG